MKKLVVVVLTFMFAVLLMPCICSAASAADTELNFDLSADGSHEVTKQKNDIITVTYSVKNMTDSDAGYDISTIANEIYYDHTFFKFVEGSAKIHNGLNQTATKRVYSNNEHRIFFNGFEIPSKTYDANQIIGTFELEVIASFGSSTISSKSAMASDGEAYTIITSDLTVTVDGVSENSEFTVKFESNGGNSLDAATVEAGEKILKPDDPRREGMRFTGWYLDKECTQKWNFDIDIVREDMVLYAGWEEISAEDGADGSLPPEQNQDKNPAGEKEDAVDWIEKTLYELPDWVWIILIILLLLILVII